MSFEIIYHELVIKEDIPKLSHTAKIQIQKAIEQRLVRYPEIYGRPLRRSLKGYRKLRMGDYRVIFRIEKNKVKIFMIGHRSIVYQKTMVRLSN